MHSDSTIDPETNKPEIIMEYNSHKGGVDTIDKMCGTYSVSRRTRRWPLVIFFQLVNIAGINSQILYNAIHFEEPEKYRRKFLKKLSMSLMQPHLSERADMNSLPLDVQHFLSKYKTPQEEQHQEEPKRKTRGRCFLCGRQKNRVTTISCHECNRSVCKEHAVTTITCPECITKGDNEAADE